MAFDIVIQGGYFIVNDTSTVEYISEPSDSVKFTVDSSSIYRFYWKASSIDGTINSLILGGSTVEFDFLDFNALIENGSPIVIGSASDLTEYLRGKIGVVDSGGAVTHTGEVTGSTALTLDPTAISNKASIAAASGMELVVNDSGTLKKVDALDFLGGSTPEPLHIISLTSTDNSSTFTEATPLIIPWDVESEKDSGFTHSNITNNSKIVVVDDSTYQFGGALRIFNNGDQRVQPLPKLRIDGVIQDMAVDSGYIRNSGSASDFWSLEFTFRPLKLTGGQNVEIQIGLESSNPVGFDGTLIGDESNFWAIKLQGAKGEKGDTGTGASIVVQEDDSTVGTVTETLNFEGAGVSSVVDEGSNKTTVTIDGGAGDMLKSVYDPTNVNADAFDYANSIGITQITGTIITPPTLNSDQDDYNPTGFSTSNWIRQQINGDRVITGFEAPPVGVNRIFGISNLSGSSNIKFKNNDSSSSAGNRLLLRDNGPDKSIKENETAIFWYDHTSSRWRPFNRIG